MSDLTSILTRIQAVIDVLRGCNSTSETEAMRKEIFFCTNKLVGLYSILHLLLSDDESITSTSSSSSMSTTIRLHPSSIKAAAKACVEEIRHIIIKGQSSSSSTSTNTTTTTAHTSTTTTTTPSNLSSLLPASVLEDIRSLLLNLESMAVLDNADASTDLTSPAMVSVPTSTKTTTTKTTIPHDDASANKGAVGSIDGFDAAAKSEPTDTISVVVKYLTGRNRTFQLELTDSVSTLKRMVEQDYGLGRGGRYSLITWGPTARGCHIMDDDNKQIRVYYEMYQKMVADYHKNKDKEPAIDERSKLKQESLEHFTVLLLFKDIGIFVAAHEADPHQPQLAAIEASGATWLTHPVFAGSVSSSPPLLSCDEVLSIIDNVRHASSPPQKMDTSDGENDDVSRNRLQQHYQRSPTALGLPQESLKSVNISTSLQTTTATTLGVTGSAETAFEDNGQQQKIEGEDNDFERDKQDIKDYIYMSPTSVLPSDICMKLIHRVNKVWSTVHNQQQDVAAVPSTIPIPAAAITSSPTSSTVSDDDNDDDDDNSSRLAKLAIAGSSRDDFRYMLQPTEFLAALGGSVDILQTLLRALDNAHPDTFTTSNPTTNSSTSPTTTKMLTRLPDVVVLRRTTATGRWIGWHTDDALRTVQIPLSNDEDCIGGRLVFLRSDGTVIQPRRMQGGILAHSGDVVHGVTCLQEGVRYGLYALREKHRG